MRRQPDDGPSAVHPKDRQTMEAGKSRSQAGIAQAPVPEIIDYLAGHANKA